MNYDQLTKLINGETIKVGKGGNQIYLDKITGLFIVQMYVTSNKEIEVFNVIGGFKNIEIAILTATKYNNNTYNHEAQLTILQYIA